MAAAVVPFQREERRATDPNAAAQRSLRLASIVQRLSKEADRRVGQRVEVEQRWVEDLTQYHGKYDRAENSRLNKEDVKSRVFVNLTRPKTKVMRARLSDMLFPTDDKNWGIDPTPVPELMQDAERAAQQAEELAAQAAQLPEGDPRQAEMLAEAAIPANAAAQLKARMDEARRRCDAMEAELEDQLRECNYNVEARLVIADGCKLGTGIIKGPIVGENSRQYWMKGPDGKFKLETRGDNRPAFYRVDPTTFFPDMDARTEEECEGFYERHLWTPQELRRRAKMPSFDADAIRALLIAGTKENTPSFLSDLRSITGEHTDSGGDRFHVWEYHGPLSAQEMEDLASWSGDEELAERYAGEADPLKEIQACVWFCQNEVIKFGVYPYDSGEPIYSVWNYEKDDSSLFGYGIPYIMRHPQRAFNAGWRMMLDNGGLSVGPQIMMDTMAVEPADGTWALKPRKIWKLKAPIPAGSRAFDTFDIPSHQVELGNIIDRARMFIDEETSLPAITEGSPGATPQQTLGGMTILQNSATVTTRDVVKNWDDDITTPCLRRLYHWNMQFSDKDGSIDPATKKPRPNIKGDYEVDARGTSVLLVRELQAANLMVMSVQFSAHPILGPLIKPVSWLRKTCQAHMLPADELVKTDEELKAEAAQPQPPPPEALAAQAQLEAKQIDAQAKIDLAYVDRETTMMEVAAKLNMTLEELKGKLEIADKQVASKERIFAAEAAVEASRPQEQGKGSGGYLS